MIEELSKNRKLYIEASAAVSSLTLKRIAHKAEGARIDAALARASADVASALSAIEAAESMPIAPEAQPEAIERHFQNGRPIDEEQPQS